MYKATAVKDSASRYNRILFTGTATNKFVVLRRGKPLPHQVSWYPIGFDSLEDAVAFRDNPQAIEQHEQEQKRENVYEAFPEGWRWKFKASREVAA